MKKIYYYIPNEDFIASYTGNITLDWFKSKFRLPIKSCFFDLPYEERYSVVVPQLQWLLNIPVILEGKPSVVQGTVESILIDKETEDEELHILINPFKE